MSVGACHSQNQARDKLHTVNSDSYWILGHQLGVCLWIRVSLRKPKDMLKAPETFSRRCRNLYLALQVTQVSSDFRTMFWNKICDCQLRMFWLLLRLKNCHCHCSVESTGGGRWGELWLHVSLPVHPFFPAARSQCTRGRLFSSSSDSGHYWSRAQTRMYFLTHRLSEGSGRTPGLSAGSLSNLCFLAQAEISAPAPCSPAAHQSRWLSS